MKIKQCVMCGCTDVPLAELKEKASAKHIKSVNECS